jgi:hypothetical protein
METDTRACPLDTLALVSEKEFEKIVARHGFTTAAAAAEGMKLKRKLEKRLRTSLEDCLKTAVLTADTQGCEAITSDHMHAVRRNVRQCLWVRQQEQQ